MVLVVPRAGSPALKNNETPTPFSRNESRGGSATVSRVGAFVAERKAEKEKAFSRVLSAGGRLFAGGSLWYVHWKRECVWWTHPGVSCAALLRAALCTLHLLEERVHATILTRTRTETHTPRSHLFISGTSQ